MFYQMTACLSLTLYSALFTNQGVYPPLVIEVSHLIISFSVKSPKLVWDEWEEIQLMVWDKLSYQIAISLKLYKRFIQKFNLIRMKHLKNIAILFIFGPSTNKFWLIKYKVG